MEDRLIFYKDKGHLYLIMLLVIFPPSLMFLVPFFYEVSWQAIKISLFILPMSLIFIYAGFRIYKSTKNKIILNQSGLLVEDFNSVLIPWSEIKSASIKVQKVYRGPTANWLVLHTKNDVNYINKKLIKLNKLIGIKGVPVCNLTTYTESPEIILSNVIGHCKP